MDQAPTVGVSELSRSLDDLFLLDVREDEEWDAGHAPAAVHIPLAQVPARLDELPEEGQVYVICRSGGRSARVAAWLNANGYDAVSVDGGMDAWVVADRRLVSETGEPPFVR